MSFKNLNLFPSIFLLTLLAGSRNFEAKSVQHPGWEFFDSEECGHVAIRSRITGGGAASIGQFPWMTRLGYLQNNGKIKFKCGGSLINRKYILTAAHCIHGFEKQLKVARLGEHFADATEDCSGGICASPVQDIPVKTMHMHPKWNRISVKNDLGLIRLADEAVYNEFVKPICLPRGEMTRRNYTSQFVEIAGWGITDSSRMTESDTLLYVAIPVRDQSACDHVIQGVEMDDTQFCVGGDTGEDSCTGDSGGPMMKIEECGGRNKTYYILGVVSVGKSYCGESPAIYTNVMKYVGWILEVVTNDERECKTITDSSAEEDELSRTTEFVTVSE